MDVSQILSQAQNLIQNNQIKQARVLLRETIQQYPSNEQAWLLTACVTETVDQSLYCLQQSIKINPQSQIAQRLLQQTESTGVCPTIVKLANNSTPVLNIQKPDLFSQPTPPQLISNPVTNQPSNTPGQPIASGMPSLPPVSPEQIYFRDNQVFVSNSRIVFSQTTIPIFQVVSISYETIHPILLRVLGVLVLLGGCLSSCIVFFIFWQIGDNLAESLNVAPETLLPKVLIICALIFLIFMAIGLILFFSQKKKFRVNIETPTGHFPAVTSKEQKYTNTVVDAINKALAERGPYIPQPGYYQNAVSAKSNSNKWPVFLISVAAIVAGVVCLFVIAPTQQDCGNVFFVWVCRPRDTYLPVLSLGSALVISGIIGFISGLIPIIRGK
jgi:hypothetical protein